MLFHAYHTSPGKDNKSTGTRDTNSATGSSWKKVNIQELPSDKSITKQAIKDTNTCSLHFKKLKPGRSSTETILHSLIFHQHCKDMNIGVKPACNNSSRACNSNWCGKQRSWETYLAFIYDCVSKITLFSGRQPSFFFTYLSQLIQNTLRWKKILTRYTEIKSN